MEEKPKGRRKVLLVHTHESVTASSPPKPCFVYREVLADGSLGDELVYAKKKRDYRTIGGVYEAQIDENRASYGGMPYVRMWSNQQDIAKWVANDETLRAERLSHKQSLLEQKSGDLGNQTLEDLRLAYQHLFFTQREHLIARVVAYLHRGGSRKKST